jgi:hypothetical protein
MGGNDGERANSYPIYQDHQRAEAFSEVFCQKMAEVAITLDGHAELVSAEMVSGNYFSALGVKPAIGRVFNSEEDDQVYKGHPVVALSYDYWMTRFAGDKSVVGKKVLVNNYPMTISRRVGAGIQRSRSSAFAKNSRADPNAAHRKSRLGHHHRLPAPAMGPGVCAAQARLHCRVGPGVASGAVHSDSPLRSNAS